MSAEGAPFYAGTMPHVTTLLDLTNVRVTQDGQVMDKTAPILTSVRLVCTCALRIPTAQIMKVVTPVLVTEDGSISGLSHTVDVPCVTQTHFAPDMANACEMDHAIASATTAVQIVQYVIQTSVAQATEFATSMVLVIVSMDGREDPWTAVSVYQRNFAAVMVYVTTIC